MPGKLVIRIHPDDRVEVKVEGFAPVDSPRPKGAKLCEKITRRLEEDIGRVLSREHEAARPEASQVCESENLQLGGL